MESLGNRTNVNDRNDDDIPYVVDTDTNRYDRINGQPEAPAKIGYDYAGNMTEDHNGYKYYYDYENRIVKIEDSSSNDVAEYTYDALGRRIRVIDSKASATTLYYYNPEWQVLAEYNGSNELQRSYVYGNYIDEVLVMTDEAAEGDPDYYYAHDHLYSVAALLEVDGDVTGRLVSLVGGGESRKRFKKLADLLWGTTPDGPDERKIGKGRLIRGKTARQVLAADGVDPDFEVAASKGRVFDYIHYMIGGMDVYFVCNQTERTEDAVCRFRVTGKSPQLWDPLTGHIQQTVAFSNSKGRTEIPMRFGPYGSMFVIFTDKFSKTSPRGVVNYKDYKPVKTIEGPWRVEFDPKWGGPKQVTFDKLISWTEHPSPGVKFYSGKAVYRSSFVFEEEVSDGKQYILDLGEVGDIGIAQAVLNGHDLGVVWTKPFRVDITEVVKSGRNLLEVSVINSWRNRLVGDRGKPQSQRYTKTNITIQKTWRLLDSGLLGPVTIQSNIERE